MSRLIIVTCRRCFSADDVSAQRAPDGTGFLYTCSNANGHDDHQPTAWIDDPDASERSLSESSGVLDDLYDPLLAVLRPGEPYLEHGIIEERLRQYAPEVFAAHVEQRGHVVFGAIRNTASNRIGMALGILRAQGHLVDRRRPGTGGWSFNTDIGFWALPPSDTGRPSLTWAEHARLTGRSAEFTNDDRLGLTSLRQGVTRPWRHGDPLP